MGHTSPVTCLQFDEIHIVSGSLDKTVRVSAVHSNPDHVEGSKGHSSIDLGRAHGWGLRDPQI
jgi:hypothetical protein